MGKVINFRLNGKPVAVYVEDNELLMNTLREKLGVLSPKYVCGIGECGACTVLVNGRPVLSCLTLARSVEGKEVVTAEGLPPDVGDVIVKAYVEEGAIQCGYCTPGFVVMTKALLEEIPNPSTQEIKEYLRGNLCRCTGYINIVKAVRRASEELKLTSKRSG